MRATVRSGLLVAVAAAGCAVDTERLGPSEGGRDSFFTKGELDQMFGMFPTCPEGDTPTRDASGWVCGSELRCPASFQHSTDGTFDVCRRNVAGADDVMVRANGFWIDRYEMTICPGDAPGVESGNDTTGRACSSPGIAPQANLSWFQAAQLCGNAGKRLCSNAEWQAAAVGTPDPGASDGTGGACVTTAAGPRNTAQASVCRSRYGAEDMVGNLWEWVAEWKASGLSWMGGVGAGSVPWPLGVGYGDDNDLVVNNNGRALTKTVYVNGAPGAAIRGGGWVQSTSGGAFAAGFHVAPSFFNGSVGARCCLRGK